ncbi:MAG TPA: pitrilysin family protein [Longimicrobium sp.]|jgi:zinc protease
MHRLCRIAAGLLAALAVAGTAAAQARHTTGPVRISYEQYELPNGLNVILSRDPSTPVVAVNVWYHVGSANEAAGRTGFAHLFEHMMFQGSENIGDDAHFKMVQEAGGTLNGSTNVDRTNYYEAVPANFLERALWLEADRMGFLLPAMTQQKLDNQRSVVQNERRQNYENQPYGLAQETIAAAMYPAGHPYSWTTIGSLKDLNAAAMEDVQGFFRTYYTPRNASLAVVGDFDPAQARQWIAKYFGDIPGGPEVTRPRLAPVAMTAEKRIVLEDRVQLPRLYMAWHTPARYAPGDAEMSMLGNILAGGKSSRLYQRLVYRDQIASSVSGGQGPRQLGGQFMLTIQAKPGVELSRIARVVDEEIARMKAAPPEARELERARTSLESGLIQNYESALGRADALNQCYTFSGNPGCVDDLLARFRAVTPAAVQGAARRYLTEGRVVLSVVPQGQTRLQVAEVAR